MQTYTIKVHDHYFKIHCNAKDEICEILVQANARPSNNLSKNARILQEDLNDYFLGRKIVFRSNFHLPKFSPFRAKVMKHMSKIAYGKTKTYKDLAKQAGSPLAQRAVGSVCARNPLPIVIPCHRVVGSQGLGGYALGLNVKRKLLQLEEAL